MAISGVAISIAYYAWDTTANSGKTGDSAQHTLRLSRDGLTVTPAGGIGEFDSTNCPGLYQLTLSAAEHTGTAFVLHGKSATSNITIVPRAWTSEPIVDTGITASAYKKRVLAVLDGNTAVSGTSPYVHTIKDKGGATETTHSISTAGNRTVS